MDFLAMILQDEVARRSQKRFVLALRRASFRSQKTLEEFDFTFFPVSTARSSPIWLPAVLLKKRSAS